ncbi:MAG: hypothetical protein NTX82_01165 [Candidatus Parcubacteria bacterium]|nr:hypothetical protein [Candidatus Parcubacteria bacterium]
MIKATNLFRKLIILSLFFLLILAITYNASAAMTWVQTSISDFAENVRNSIDISGTPGDAKIVADDVFGLKWDTDGVDVTSHQAQMPKVIDGGGGNSIIAYLDYDNGYIYAQKMNSSGVGQWGSGVGIPISSSSAGTEPQIVADDAGGAIISWIDGTALYAQRIDSSGITQWNSHNPVVISNTSTDKLYNVMVADSAGGAVMGWIAFSDPNYYIYAQRINSSGVVQWTANGVEISDLVDWASLPKIATDGSGGAIMTWNYGTDVYAQKINSGAVSWAENGVVVSDSTYDQVGPKIVSDGLGGAIITWEEEGFSWNRNVFAQRLDTDDGSRLWGSNGVMVNSNIISTQQFSPEITTDGSGGALIVYLDDRLYHTAIYCGRVDSDGVIMEEEVMSGIERWGSYNDLSISSDNAGEAIVGWTEGYSPRYIYAQKIDAGCNTHWTTDGETVSPDTNPFSTELAFSVNMSSDGSGGAYFVWQPTPDGGEPFLIYAQDAGNIPTYSTAGTMISKVFDAGAGDPVTFNTISWNENLPANTDLTFQTKTSLNTDWINEFDDGLMTDIYHTDFSEFPSIGPGTVFLTKNEASNEVVFSQHTDPLGVGYTNASIEFLTGHEDQNPAFYPAGSVITARVKLNIADAISFPYAYIGVFNSTTQEDWLDSNFITLYESDFGTWQEVTYTTTQAFNLAGVNVYSDYIMDSSDSLEIDWIKIELPSSFFTGPTWPVTWNNPTVLDATWITAWGGEFTGQNEITGDTVFSNPTIADSDYYVRINTGKPANFFPAGSTITGRVRVDTDSTIGDFGVYMFNTFGAKDDWAEGNEGETYVWGNTVNDWVYFTYTTISAFNEIGFDLRNLNIQAGDTATFTINSISIGYPVSEPPLPWSDWSAAVTNPSGSSITSPQGRYIEYKANFSTSDTSASPMLYDVTINSEDAIFLDDNVNITASVDPTLSLAISNNACTLGLLTADAIQTCGYNASVTTNAPNGYTGYIRQNQGFQSTNGTVTSEIKGENDTPLQIDASGTLSGLYGEYGIGIQTADTTDWPEFTGLCSDYDDQAIISLPAKAADWSTSADPDAYLGNNIDNIFASNSEPVDGVTLGLTLFCHGVKIKWNAPPGSYSQIVTITAVGNF